ncbi:MAG: methyltransferase domain-containing protein [Nannocystaceae bacterium]
MTRLLHPRFVRANRYHPDWVLARGAGGANALWLTEWLAESLGLRAGMRVLDRGCGKAASSVFLRREFGVEVWAADLWFDAEQNRACAEDAGVGDGVHAVHADARALPFEPGFFDAIVSIDSYQYYGTDDLYTHCIARLLAPGGVLAIAGAGLTREFEGEVPAALQDWWEPSLCCLHSAAWWQQHWRRSGALDVLCSDTLPDAWQLWLQWQREIAPDNQAEIDALVRDAGAWLTYVRTIARRREGVQLDPLPTSIATRYQRMPLLRDG